MQKRWLWIVSLGLLAAMGCAENNNRHNNGGNDGTTKLCTDGPAGSQYTCPATSLCCGGTCVVESDDNCGKCGNRCTNGNSCNAGACICEATQLFCSNTCTSSGCVDTKHDSHNCGRIGNDCGGGKFCDNGECSATCSEDICNGECVDTQSSIEHCGDCDTKCLTTDAAKHIVIGYCMAGDCRIVCEKNFVDEDGNTANGCEKEVAFSCGNGIVEQGEQCDGERLNDQTCASVLGEGSQGTLRCADDCLGFVTTSCSKPTTCGNGRIDGVEKCDGKELNGATCATVLGGGSTGFVACSENCMDYDTSECTAPTTYGNGVIDGNEKCDSNTLLNNATCKSVVGPGSSGTLKCSNGNYDISECSAAAVCGNGIIESNYGAEEQCDGNLFGGQSCESVVGAGSRGSLRCIGCRIDPSNCSAPASCGNGKIEGNERCDKTDIGGKTCADYLGDGATGTLKCASNCMDFDFSQCSAPVTCGNNIIEKSEACDGIRLNDQTCTSVLGYASEGTLACNPDCLGFDTSGCRKSSTCGNGNLEAGEVCDTTILNGATCDRLVGKGSVGNVTCADGCKSYNLSGCSAPSTCNNGTIDDGEVCDGNDIQGKTCADLVGMGSEGTVTCGDGCKHFDVSKCSTPHGCGNNAVEAGELCDGTNFAGRTCADVVGYGSTGVLQCAKNCQSFITTLCSPEKKCGNGSLDEGEVCDGKMLNGASCASRVGWGSTGTLACNSTCTGFVTTGCSPEVKCGNGRIDEGEICDSTEVNNRSCEQQVGHGSTGKPGCNSNCNGYTVGSCTPEVKCGNGRIDDGEACDSNLLQGATCESVVGVGSTGTLKCKPGSCEYDTTGCGKADGCGNDRIDSSELCDGSHFTDGTDCKTYEPSLYSGGTVSCTAKCELNFTACTKLCGNGRVDSGEACDGSAFPANRNSCESIVGTGSTGTLSCSNDCKTILTNNCTVAKYCGNGRVDDDESCDGKDFSKGTDDCSAWGNYRSGNKVTCRGDCTFDTSDCIPLERCGDGIVNGDEECDGSNFFGDETSCTEWSNMYAAGELKCNNSTCKIDESECLLTSMSRCGDNILGADELCDGDKFRIQKCSEWNPKYQDTGSLQCTGTCMIDDTGCRSESYCGDGKVKDDEKCDGNKFLNDKTSCKDLFPSLYASGEVKCNDSCGYDVSGCNSWCGNGKINNDANVKEDCDPARSPSPFPSNKATCAQVIGSGYEGTLKCSDSCKFDTSDCHALICGDGIVNQNSEYCDKTAFYNDKDNCSDWNDAYVSGKVKCKDNCTLDYGDCVKEAAPYCGDGIVNQSNEECDHNAFKADSDTCTKFNSIYSGGSLSCKDDCTIDDSKCIRNSQTTCGDGNLDEDELCDGSLSRYPNCTDLSDTYVSGTVKCTDDCYLDTSNCISVRCGDDIVNGTEQCDGTKFLQDVDDCADYSSNYASGKLGCKTDCTLDTSSCVGVSKCGNGTIDNGEQCDPGADGNTYTFPDNANSCEKYNWNYSGGTLKCNTSCQFDTSACTHITCTENEARCYGNSLQMCDNNSSWEEIQLCKGQTPVCEINGSSGMCTAAEMVAPIVPIWCNFQWLDDSLTHKGYGRILLPEGYEPGDVSGYMLCTDDLSKPLLDANDDFVWDAVAAAHNTGCGDCGYNTEFMTSEDYAGKPGTNFCTFAFQMVEEVDDDLKLFTFACRPIQAGASEPIQVIPGKSHLTEGLTRSFLNEGCVDGTYRCINNTPGMCIGGSWLDVEPCSGATPLCDLYQGQCIAIPVSYDNTYDMSGITIPENYGYGYTLSGSKTYSDGSTIVISHVAAYDKDHLIDGRTAVMRGSKQSTITITGLASGIGTLSFQYATWKASDSATLTISDGTTDKELVVKSTDLTPQLFSVDFFNPTASQISITISPNTDNTRTLIDDVRWTSAY